MSSVYGINNNLSQNYWLIVTFFSINQFQCCNNNGVPVPLRWIPTQTISRQQCRQQISLASQQHMQLVRDTSFFTINAPAQGGCRGDSGGPLVTRDGVFIGILNFATCGQNIPHETVPFPEIYVSVFAYIDFIRAVINAPIQ